MSDKLTELIERLKNFVKELDFKYDGDPIVKRGLLIAIGEAKKLQAEPDQAKWAVVNKYWMYDTKEDAEEAIEKYLPVCEAKDSIIVKIIEP